jgi:hypothetical protein
LTAKEHEAISEIHPSFSDRNFSNSPDVIR